MIAPNPTTLKDPSGYTRYSCDDDEGFFFLYQPRGNGVLNTFHCREEVAGVWDDEPRCRWLGFMWTERIMVRRVERLWTQFETAMGVTEHTVFHRIAKQNGEVEINQVLLHLSPFWTKTQTHRSVCTLLLRLLVVHYTDSWDKAVEAYELAQVCREALEHWLGGATKPTYREWNEEYEKWIDSNCEGDEPDDLTTDYGYGFVGEFANASTDDIKRKLVKP